MSTHALVFALDISKTRTGVCVLRVPFITADWSHPKIEILAVSAIVPDFGEGAQRVWFPTARSFYDQLMQRFILKYRHLYPEDVPICAYEGAAWGSNTSEMMVYIQQRLFEFMDSHPMSNMDLMGFSPAFCRKVVRLWVGEEHSAHAKNLAKNIYTRLCQQHEKLLVAPVPEEKRVSQDAKDAVMIGLAAALLTVQFLRPAGHNDQFIASYSGGEVLYNSLAEFCLGMRGINSHAHPNHPLNLREMLKDLKKRDEHHLSPQNPYLYPARTYRIVKSDTNTPYPASDQYFQAWQGLPKQGIKLAQTLIHRHG